MSINTISEGVVGGEGDTARFAVTNVAAGEVLTFHLEALSGAVTMVVMDSSGYLHGPITADPANSSPLGHFGTWQLRARSTPPTAIITGSGEYRVRAYRADPSPESSAADLQLGDTVTGEWLDVLSDIDIYTFEGQAGDDIIAFVRGSYVTGAPTLIMQVSGHGVLEGVHITPTAEDTTELERNPHARVVLPMAGSYTVKVTGLQPAGSSFVGPYELLLRKVDRRPEGTSPSSAMQDTVIARLDHVGDIDEFVVTGTPGSEYIALFRGTPDRPSDVMFLDVDTGQARPLSDGPTITSGDPDAPLSDRTSGRFTLSASGEAIVRVRPAYYGLARGPYELAVLAIDRAVESATPAIALGDSVFLESLDHPGDVDEFALTVPDSGLANLVYYTDPSSAWVAEGRFALQVDVLPGSPPTREWPPVTTGYGTVPLPAGTYTVRVQSSEHQIRPYFGRYQLHLHPIRSEPETAPSVIAIGDTIADALDPPGDIDRFFFTGRKGDQIDVQLQGLSPTGIGEFLALLRTPTVPPFGTDLIATTWTPTNSPDLEAYHTERLDLTETGTYSITILPNGNGGNPDETGAYRLAVIAVDQSSEDAPMTIQAGDTVDTESLDYPGDVDQFSLVGPAGQELTLFLTATATASQGVALEVLDPSTNDVVDQVQSYIATEVTGRFALPPSGVLKVRVQQKRDDGPYSLVGPYRLDVVAVNRAPELASAVVSVGDTISGEAIDPRGDIDEYTLASSGAGTIVVDFQTPSGAFGWPGLTLEVVEQATGTVVGTATTINPTAALEDVGTGPIVLNSSSSYVIRVRGAWDRQSYGLYRFAVRQLAP